MAAAKRFVVSVPAGDRVSQHVPWDKSASALEWRVIVHDARTVDLKVFARVSQGGKTTESVIHEVSQGTSFQGCFQPPGNEGSFVQEIVFDLNNTFSWFNAKQVEIFAMDSLRKAHVPELPLLQPICLERRTVQPADVDFFKNAAAPNLLEPAPCSPSDPLILLCDALEVHLDAWQSVTKMFAADVQDEDCSWLFKLQQSVMSLRAHSQHKTEEKRRELKMKEALESLKQAEEEQRLRKESEAAAELALEGQRLARAAQLAAEAQRLQERVQKAAEANGQSTMIGTTGSGLSPQSQSAQSADDRPRRLSLELPPESAELQNDLSRATPSRRRSEPLSTQLLSTAESNLSESSCPQVNQDGADEAQRMVAEKAAAAAAAAEHAEAERAVAQRAAEQHAEAEQATAQAGAAADRAVSELIALQRAEAEKAEAERLAAEQAAAEKREAEREAVEEEQEKIRKSTAEQIGVLAEAADAVQRAAYGAEHLATFAGALHSGEAEELPEVAASELQQASQVRLDSTSTSQHVEESAVSESAEIEADTPPVVEDSEDRLPSIEPDQHPGDLQDEAAAADHDVPEVTTAADNPTSDQAVAEATPADSVDEASRATAEGFAPVESSVKLENTEQPGCKDTDDDTVMQEVLLEGQPEKAPEGTEVQASEDIREPGEAREEHLLASFFSDEFQDEVDTNSKDVLDLAPDTSEAAERGDDDVPMLPVQRPTLQADFSNGSDDEAKTPCSKEFADCEDW